MAIEPPAAPSPAKEALMVWLKLAGLLAGLAVFGWLVFRLTRSI